MTVDELQAFEREIAEAFNRGEIRSPIHLSGGNESALIRVFKDVGPEDWIFTNWRSHYHCLLRGVPPEQLKADIMAGKSITLNYPSHRIFASAIVGGILPVALGVALSIKRSGGKNKVWVFVGEMTAAGGAFHECAQYAQGHELPIHFVVEDNGKSVCTDTWKVWGGLPSPDLKWGPSLVTHYDYKLPHHHSGAGHRVQF